MSKKFLIILFFILIMIMISSFAYSQKSGEINNERRSKIEKSNEEIQYLKNTEKEFEHRITELEALVDSIEKSFDTAKWIIAFIVAFGSALIGFLQYLKQKRENEEKSRIEKYISQLQQSNEKLAANNEQFYKKSQEHIVIVMKLIQSIDKIFEIANTAKDLDEKMKKFEEQHEIQQKSIENRNRSIIKEADQLYNEIDINNYKKRSYQNRIGKFEADFPLSIEEAEKDTIFPPYCYLLIALHYIVEVLFTNAVRYLDIAVKKANGKEEYNELIHTCLFHKAIIYYNFSMYDKALGFFKQCTQFDSSNALTWTYIPEAQHLLFIQKLEQVKSDYGEIPEKNREELKKEHEKVKQEFLNVEDKLKKLTAQQGYLKGRNRILSLLYVKFGNFYFKAPERKLLNDKKYLELLEEARKKYEQAIEEDSTFYLPKLSFAQAVFIQSDICNVEVPSEIKRKALGYISEVYADVRLKEGDTTEPKISIMYNYILGICENILSRYDKNFIKQNYLDRIFDFKKSLPLPFENKEIRIFSPYSKKDLIFDELIKEINKLKED